MHTTGLRVLVSAFLVVASVSVVAQAPPPNPTPGPPSPTPSSRTPPQTRPPQEQVRPIFVSGRVVMEDGNAPPEPVAIERVCNSGAPRREGYTDARGYFSLQLGSGRGVLPDASTSGFADEFDDMTAAGLRTNSTSGRANSGAPPLMGCELRASLGGHISTVISLHNRQALDNPDVGTLMLYPTSRAPGTSVSLADLRAPKSAKKEMEKAQKLERENPAEAEAHLRKAVELYPQYATAWFQLGLLHERAGRLDEARAAYAQSISADERFVRPYIQLAGVASLQQKWQESADMSAKAVALNPFAFPHAHLINAMANYHLQNLEAAEASARKVRLLDTEQRLPVAHLLLGTLLLRKNEYAEAAEGFRAFLKAAPQSPDAPAIRIQLQEIEKKLSAEAGVRTKP